MVEVTATKEGNDKTAVLLRTEDAVAFVTSIKELQELPESVQTARLDTRVFKRHINPCGSIGGFVESTAQVDKSVFMSANTLALDHARVTDSVKLCGYATVSENSSVGGRAFLSGHVHVSGSAHVDGETRLYHRAEVSEHAQVGGNAELHDNARILGKTKISGFARIDGNTEMTGEAEVSNTDPRTRPHLT